MSINLLSPELIVNIFSYLEYEDKNRCSNVCRLFREIIEHSPNGLLTKSTIEQRILQRHFNNALVKPDVLSDTLSGSVENLFSFQDLLIGTTKYGEAKIWHLGNNESRTLYTIFPLSDESGIRLPAVFSHSDNCLIRSALKSNQDTPALALQVDIWEMDASNGSMKKLFSNTLPTILTLADTPLEIVAPIRYNDKIYIPLPKSSIVQVWNFDKLFDTIEDNIFFKATGPVNRLQIIDDTLFVGYHGGAWRVASFKDRSSCMSTPYPGAKPPHDFNRFTCVCGSNKEITLEDVVSNKHTCRIGVNNEGMKLGLPFAYEEGWIAAYATDDTSSGICLFNMEVREKFDAVYPQGYIPNPSGVNTLHHALGCHQYVQAHKNVCNVYALWNLHHTEEKLIPSKSYSLPANSQISTLSFHQGKLIVGTSDGSVWKFESEKKPETIESNRGSIVDTIFSIVRGILSKFCR